MPEELASLLFAQGAPDDAQRFSLVEVRPSPSMWKTASTQRAADGRTTHNFRTLLEDRATAARNRIEPELEGASQFKMVTRPTKFQAAAFDLLRAMLERPLAPIKSTATLNEAQWSQWFLLT